MKLTRQAMSIMPGSKRQKDIIKKLNIVRKELKLEPVKEDKEMDKFLDDLANNTPNEDQFDEVSDKNKLKVLARKIQKFKDKAFKKTMSTVKSPLYKLLDKSVLLPICKLACPKLNVSVPSV